jgi:hypothetical protein
MYSKKCGLCTITNFGEHTEYYVVLQIHALLVASAAATCSAHSTDGDASVKSQMLTGCLTKGKNGNIAETIREKFRYSVLGTSSWGCTHSLDRPLFHVVSVVQRVYVLTEEISPESECEQTAAGFRVLLARGFPAQERKYRGRASRE